MDPYVIIYIYIYEYNLYTTYIARAQLPTVDIIWIWFGYLFFFVGNKMVCSELHTLLHLLYQRKCHIYINMYKQMAQMQWKISIGRTRQRLVCSGEFILAGSLWLWLGSHFNIGHVAMLDFIFFVRVTSPQRWWRWGQWRSDDDTKCAAIFDILYASNFFA